MNRILIQTALCGVFLITSPCRAEDSPPVSLADIDVKLVDDHAIAFATFQSHNQKIVSNRHGLFLAYLKAAKEDYMAQTWRLVHSSDGGRTFKTLHEATHATNPPVLETDSLGNLFLIRPDFKDGNAYLYRFNAADKWKTPAISTIPRGSAGKFCMVLDEPRKQLYYFAHNNTFHIVALDGKVRSSVDLIRPGKSGYLQYPHLTLDADGTLYAAWTSLKDDNSTPNGYIYWDIHAVRSSDGAANWQKLDGTQLQIPIVADETGPTDRITRDDEFKFHSWLSAFMVKDRKLHVAYWVKSHPQRQRYVRYNVNGGKPDVDIEPMIHETAIEQRNDNGAFAARRSIKESTLYFVTAIEDRRRLACLASDDNGKTWYRYATGATKYPHRVYSIGTARNLTADGGILGTFTDVRESAKTYYEPNSGRVHLFRIPAGISKAKVAEIYEHDGRVEIKFGLTRGQPAFIQFSSDKKSWTEWQPFASSLVVPLSKVPAFYRLKSRLEVVSPAYSVMSSSES